MNTYDVDMKLPLFPFIHGSHFMTVSNFVLGYAEASTIS